MGAGKPTVLIIGQPGDGMLEIMVELIRTFGAEARLCPLAEEAVDLAIAGKADVLIYKAAPDLTGPETFEAIRWGYSLAGFIYAYALGDHHKDRIIEDVRARTIAMPFTLRQIKATVEAVSPACKRAFEQGKTPA